jgi:hypothetical protein
MWIRNWTIYTPLAATSYTVQTRRMRKTCKNSWKVLGLMLSGKNRD